MNFLYEIPGSYSYVDHKKIIISIMWFLNLYNL